MSKSKVFNFLKPGEAIQVGTRFVACLPGGTYNIDGVLFISDVFDEAQVCVSKLSNINPPQDFKLLGAMYETGSAFITEEFCFGNARQFDNQDLGVYKLHITLVAQDEFAIMVDKHSHKIEGALFGDIINSAVQVEGKPLIGGHYDTEKVAVFDSLLDAQDLEKKVREVVRARVQARFLNASLSEGGVTALLEALGELLLQINSGHSSASISQILDIREQLESGLLK